MNLFKIKFFKFTLVLLILLTFFITGAFPFGDKEKVPAKVNPNISVPNGEYLLYGNYVGGEKIFDAVYVTIHKTNEDGKLLYYVYSEIIPFPRDFEVSKDYKNWSSEYIIDPVTGSVLEGRQDYSNLDKRGREIIDKYAMKDVFQTHYIYHQDKGYVEYITKTIVDNNIDNIKERRYKVNVKSEFPAWDSNLVGGHAPRIMNLLDGGIIYSIAPQFLKEPMPISFTRGETKEMETKAGTFKVYQLIGNVVDPFLGKLLAGFIKGGAQWVEDSDRRLNVFYQRSPNDISILEEISIVPVE